MGSYYNGGAMWLLKGILAFALIECSILASLGIMLLMQPPH